MKLVTVAAVYIYTCSSLESRKLDTISYPPIPTFILLSILEFAAIDITFNDVTFLFKIDHDDGTVKHILSHLVDE